MLTAQPGTRKQAGSVPVGVAPSGRLAPSASHGNQAHRRTADEATEQRSQCPGPAGPSGCHHLRPVPQGAGPPVTLAFREAEEGVLPPMGHPTILIIDGEVQSRDWLAATLSVEGFDVVTAADGSEGVALAGSVNPSLMLLDMELGDTQGLSVFRQICAISSVPVIMVTGRDDELDAVLALEAGAADHVTKPPRPRELTARIRAVLRRVGHQLVDSRPRPHQSGVVSLGPVTIDVSIREALVRGQPVELSRKEFDLLALLVSEAGNVVTRKQCMERIWRDHAKG